MRSRPSKPVRQRVWSVGRFLVLVAGLTATFGIFFLAALGVTTRTREVQVPDLKGKSVAEAKAMISDLGLTPRIDDVRRPDRSVPADHVLSQDPGAGTVLRRQRPVRIRLSEGLRAPALPVVTDLPERTAEVTLAAAQIAIGGRAEIRSTRYLTGQVVAQDPGAGQRAATVTLLVNRGDPSVSVIVPDLIGSLGIRAVEILRTQGFRVAVTAEVPYPGLPPGVVVKQAPQAGFRILPSDTLMLEVSR